MTDFSRIVVKTSEIVTDKWGEFRNTKIYVSKTM